MTSKQVKARKVASWVMLVGGIIGWPVSALFPAKDEPQFVLGLSWIAIILGGYNGVQIATDA